MGTYRVNHRFCCADQERTDVDLDREFLQGLRELKFLSEKEVVDEHKAYVPTDIISSHWPCVLCVCLYVRLWTIFYISVIFNNALLPSVL